MPPARPVAALSGPPRGRGLHRAALMVGGMTAAALALAAATLWLATEASPRVSGNSAAAAGAGTHLRQWLRQHDPRRVRDGRLVRVQATAQEVELLADQAAHLAGGAARTQLMAGRLTLQFSLPLRWPGTAAPARWLNVDLRLRDGPAQPGLVETVSVGHLNLPRPLTAAALRLALAWWDRPANGAAPWHTMLQALQMQPQQLVLRYRWRADLPQRLADWFMPPARLATLRPYHEALRAELLASTAPPPLTALLAPVFSLAAQRSAAGDAAAENRAALLVLAAYASGQPAARWWPQAAVWPPLPPRGAVFGGRGDFAQHYLVSAALAAEAGGPLADALGALKEVGDTRGGSGFSFTDIAANRAGARLGELAVRAPGRVQALLAGAPQDTALLPAVDDLPEFMGRREFEARFGGVGAPAYEAMISRIDARLDALDAYR
ncbi:MAG: hypothetical protein H6933_17430 [Burkholderiaceae bacterium]|nr:hypothetical protein [Burkholderiaceae bacterium]